MKKALYFGDKVRANKIITADDALECKRIPREIKAFDVQVWNEVAEGESYYGISEKFKQNTNLKDTLLYTGEKTIVENSHDRTWGSGIELHSVDSLNKNTWNGSNLLGKILMDIRDDINKENEVD